MKAVAVYPNERESRLIEHPEPQPAASADVKMRMLEVGICGTDREITQFQYGTPPPGAPYLVLGHESLAEVVETGSEVKGVRPGDLVVTSVRRPCPHDMCVPCRTNRQDFCFTGDFTERGIKELHGFMTEYIVDDERYLHVVPADLREVGVLVEPLTIAEKALAQVWQVQRRLPWGQYLPGENAAPERADSFAPDDLPGRGRRAVVLGAGPVGLLGAMALVVSGFTTHVYSREPPASERARIVESFGAKYISSQTHTVAQLREEVGGIDLVYEAIGASELAFEVLKVLATNGVFVLTGVPGRHHRSVEVDTDFLMLNLVVRNQIVLGTVNAGHEAFAAAIRDLTIFMERFPQAVRALITARLPPEAHLDLLLGRVDGIKNVMKLA